MSSSAPKASCAEQRLKSSPSKDQSIDGDDKNDYSRMNDKGNSSPTISRKRPRTTFSQSQLLELEKEFIHTAYLDRANRISLANKLNLKEKQIKVWFQNRRMKKKRDDNEHKRRKTFNVSLLEVSTTPMDHGTKSNSYQNSFETFNHGAMACNDISNNSVSSWTNNDHGYQSYGFELAVPSSESNTRTVSSLNRAESFFNQYHDPYDIPTPYNTNFHYSSMDPHQVSTQLNQIPFPPSYSTNYYSDLPCCDPPYCNYYN